MSLTRKRALIGSAVLASLALGHRVTTSAWGVLSAQRAETREQTERLADARVRIARISATRDALARVLQSFLALAPQLVEGGTRAEASAALSSAISGLASTHALSVRRVESLADSNAGALQPVAVRAELDGDIHGVSALLAAIETHPWLLSVARLSITALDPGNTGSAREVLRLELRVNGWFHARGGS